MTEPADQPLLSIVVPTYNRGAYVTTAVSSALAQSEARLEVIVVDDSSTDDTAEACRALARRDPRVRPLRVRHGGLGAARNAGIAAARGRWVAFLDDDDLLDPEFAATMIRFAGDRHPVCVCDAVTFSEPLGAAAPDEGPGPVSPRLPVLVEPWAGTVLDAITLPDLLLAARFPVNAALVRTDVARDLGGFREGFDPCEDYDLWLRALERFGSVPVLHRPLAYVRRHERQMTGDLGAMARATLAALARTLARRPELRGTVARRELGRRLGTLHREVAYSALLHGRRAAALGAALQAIRFLPGDGRAWAYALLAPFPLAYRGVRDLLGRPRLAPAPH